MPLPQNVSSPFVVQKGQTLSSIAVEMKEKDPSLKDIPLYGKDGLIERIQKANGIKDANKISSGQELKMDMNSILGNDFSSGAKAAQAAAKQIANVETIDGGTLPQIEVIDKAPTKPERKTAFVTSTQPEAQPLQFRPLSKIPTQVPQTLADGEPVNPEAVEPKKGGFLSGLFGRKDRPEVAREEVPVLPQDVPPPEKVSKPLPTTDEMIASTPSKPGSHGERTVNSPGVSGTYEIIENEEGYSLKTSMMLNQSDALAQQQLLTRVHRDPTGAFFTKSGARSQDYSFASQMGRAYADELVVDNSIYADLQAKKASGNISKGELMFMQRFEKQLQDRSLQRNEQGELIDS